MKKTTKANALAERIAENRRGMQLTPEEDAKLLAAYLAKPKAGEPRPSLRSVAAEFGRSVGAVRRAIARASEES